MRWRYRESDDQTELILDGESVASVSGEITRWKNGIPHPNTDAFDEFEEILLQMNTPDEREILLHLIAGNVGREGFTDRKS